jgi:hypothetical protein
MTPCVSDVIQAASRGPLCSKIAPIRWPASAWSAVARLSSHGRGLSRGRLLESRSLTRPIVIAALGQFWDSALVTSRDIK